jgi:hypothetical protein
VSLILHCFTAVSAEVFLTGCAAGCDVDEGSICFEYFALPVHHCMCLMWDRHVSRNDAVRVTAGALQGIAGQEKSAL